jgi:hypothetical protein
MPLLCWDIHEKSDDRVAAGLSGRLNRLQEAVTAGCSSGGGAVRGGLEAFDQR